MGPTSKSLLTMIILLAVIAAASYFAVTRSKPQPEEGRGHAAVLMCSDPECQKIFSQRVIAGQSGPYRCIRCGRKLAYQAVRCDSCGQIFAYHVEEVPTEGGTELTGTTECPACGYERFTRIKKMEEVKKPAAERE